MMPLRERFSTPRSSVMAILSAIAIAAVLLVNAILAYVWALESQSVRRLSETKAAQVASALSAYTAGLETMATAIGEASPVAEDPALALRIQGLHSAQVLRLGPLGIADPAFDTTQLSNNIEADLVGKAFKGSAAPAEAYPDSGRWLLSVAVPLYTSGRNQPTGVALLRADVADVLERLIAPTVPEGELALWSAAGGSFEPVARAGGPAAPSAEIYRVPAGIGRLHASFSPGEAFLEANSITGLPLILSGLAGAALLAFLVAFAFRQLRTQLQLDTGNLVDLATRQRSATASAPRLHFPELEPLAETLVGMRRDESRRSDPGKVTSAKETGPVVDESPLEIEIIEEKESGELHYGVDAGLVVPAEIFRDYDVRGEVAQLRPELAHAIGQAIGSEALARDRSAITVGMDGRDSSPMLREHLVRGLLSTGIDVIDVGTVATPMLYFACHHLHTLSGVMVTGSHNPPDHNGFKIMIGGETLCGAAVQGIYQRILEEDFAEGQGSYRVTEIDADYIKAVSDDVLVADRLRVVLDCGNGAAAVVAVELFEQLGCEVLPLYCELDGSFPNHHPDPSVPQNLRALIAEVSERGADLGIAFDGDGDRIGVVSAAGRIVTADRLMMLFARDMLSRNPGADVVFDVKCSRDLPGIISQSGGRPIMWRSGHSWIKEKMKETGALLGGEFTGHICFRDRWFGFDDALYCGARLLEILTTEARTLDELLAELPKSVATPEIRIEVGEEQKFAVMQRVREHMRLEGARLLQLDGVRAEYPDGWGLVRASNTSPALICRFEAQTEAALARIQSAFHDELARLLPRLDIPF